MELTAIQGSTEGIPSEHLHAITLWDLQGKHIPIQELHAACELAGIPKDEWPVPDSAEVVMGRAQRKVKGELGSAHRTVQFTAKFTKQLLIDQVPHLGYKLTIVRHIEPSDSDEAVDTEDEGTAQIGGSEIVTAAIYLKANDTLGGAGFTEETKFVFFRIREVFNAGKLNFDPSHEVSPWLVDQTDKCEAVRIHPRGGAYLILSKYRDKRWNKVVNALRLAYKRDVVFELEAVGSEKTGIAVLAMIRQEVTGMADQVADYMEKGSRSDGRTTRIAKLDSLRRRVEAYREALGVNVDDIAEVLKKTRRTLVVNKTAELADASGES